MNSEYFNQKGCQKYSQRNLFAVFINTIIQILQYITSTKDFCKLEKLFTFDNIWDIETSPKNATSFSLWPHYDTDSISFWSYHRGTRLIAVSS